MSPTGDMTFGQGSQNFLINSPAAVAQAIGTRLRLWTNEWFLDLTEGTPWLSQVLGTHTINLYDQAITQRILGTPGVVSLASYASQLNRATRKLTVEAVVNTQYGQAALNPPIIIAL
jgi:hypothetical protein